MDLLFHRRLKICKITIEFAHCWIWCGYLCSGWPLSSSPISPSPATTGVHLFWVWVHQCPGLRGRLGLQRRVDAARRQWRRRLQGTRRAVGGGSWRGRRERQTLGCDDESGGRRGWRRGRRAMRGRLALEEEEGGMGVDRRIGGRTAVREVVGAEEGRQERWEGGEASWRASLVPLAASAR